MSISPKSLDNTGFLRFLSFFMIAIPIIFFHVSICTGPLLDACHILLDHILFATCDLKSHSRTIHDVSVPLLHWRRTKGRHSEIFKCFNVLDFTLSRSKRRISSSRRLFQELVFWEHKSWQLSQEKIEN